MLKEIKSFHPELTEGQLDEYVGLVYNIMNADMSNDPDEVDKATKIRDEFVEKHLPRLDEALRSYEKKVKERLRQMTAGDPVDIALSSPIVVRWMAKNMKGRQYSTGVRRINESKYAVEFRSPEGPELHVDIDVHTRRVEIVFQRTFNP